jgi:hypothetical protein
MLGAHRCAVARPFGLPAGFPLNLCGMACLVVAAFALHFQPSRETFKCIGSIPPVPGSYRVIVSI